MSEINALGQPVGDPVPDWTARPRPPRTPIDGTRVRIEPLDPAAHGESLYAAFSEDTAGANWTYMGYGPFDRQADFQHWLEGMADGDDPLFHTVVDLASGRCLGLMSYLRIDPANGVIEIGHIHFSPSLQGTAAATEAQYLMMRRVFDELGYRRYEWKCNALNAPSCRAAERLGFIYEGTFRQAVVVKGRNRDTAWYAILDGDWPAIRAGFETWLAADNFDAEGRQRRSLAGCRG